MLSEVFDVFEVLLFDPSEPIASLRTIGLALLLAWLIGRVVARWFESGTKGKGGGGGGGKPEKPPQQPKSGGGRQQEQRPQQKGGAGGGGAAVVKPGLLEGILAGIGAGIGATLAGLGAGLGASLGGLARGIGSGLSEIGRGRSHSGQHYLGGPQASNGRGASAHNGAWTGAAAGLGIGLGLGAAASWARSQAHHATETARDAWQNWQEQRAWNAWHTQGAPAYAWTVNDPAAQAAMADAFDEAGVRYGWQPDPVTGDARIVVNAEDLETARAAMDAAGLEFAEYGEPIGYDGAPWDGVVLSYEEWLEQQGMEQGETEIYDPETGEWVPVEPAEPGGGGETEAGDVRDGPALPADTWGGFDQGAGGDEGAAIVIGGETGTALATFDGGFAGGE